MVPFAYPTGMTQNPYADGGFDDAISEPPRTSVMAILSLVTSLIGCCLPIGILGVLLGIFSLLGIGKSQGRVTGKGLAISGIIVGLVTTALWVGAYVAVQKGIGVYAESTGEVITAIETGDYTTARAALAPTTTISDEQFDAFRAKYQDGLGSFVRTPEGFVELIQSFVDPTVGPQMESYQGQQNMMPITGFFDSGNALMLFFIDPNTQGPSGMPAYTDIVIVLPDGTEVRLTDAVEVGSPDEDPDVDG